MKKFYIFLFIAFFVFPPAGKTQDNPILERKLGHSLEGWTQIVEVRSLYELHRYVLYIQNDLQKKLFFAFEVRVPNKKKDGRSPTPTIELSVNRSGFYNSYIPIDEYLKIFAEKLERVYSVRPLIAATAYWESRLLPNDDETLDRRYRNSDPRRFFRIFNRDQKLIGTLNYHEGDTVEISEDADDTKGFRRYGVAVVDDWTGFKVSQQEIVERFFRLHKSSNDLFRHYTLTPLKGIDIELISEAKSPLDPATSAIGLKGIEELSDLSFARLNDPYSSGMDKLIAVSHGVDVSTSDQKILAIRTGVPVLFLPYSKAYNILEYYEAIQGRGMGLVGDAIQRSVGITGCSGFFN